MIYVAGALPVRVLAHMLPNSNKYSDDNVVLTLQFSDGSVGTVIYIPNGDKSLSKERFEVFTGARTAVLDNFRRLELRHNGRVKIHRSILRQDKGHRAEWQAFVSSIMHNSYSDQPIRNTCEQSGDICCSEKCVFR
jgi:predicted dehydrogenase